MKSLMLISVIMLVGCATAPTAESMAGTYELKKDGYTVRLIFRENGAFEAYKNGNKDEDEGKWKILNGEIHVKAEDGWVIIFRINPDGGIVGIKEITSDGIQKDVLKEDQVTFKKTNITPTIKSVANAKAKQEVKAANAEKVLRAMVIGVYEYKDGENIQRAIFQNNGVLEVYVNSKNEGSEAKWKKEEAEAKWRIKGGELLVEEKDGHIEVSKIDKDGSITVIAQIEAEDRRDYPKGKQRTYKKIK